MNELTLKKNKKNNIFFCIIVFGIILSIIIRIINIPFKSPDYLCFLEVWFNAFKEMGWKLALAIPIGDYNIPYVSILIILTFIPVNSLISIKIVSIIFDYILAISIYFLICELFHNDDKKKIYGIIGFFSILFLPTVLINSSMWGQCDVIYTCFIIISIVLLIKEKSILSFIFLGISFAFKLQFIFVLPLYIGIYLSEKKFPFYYFFIVPLVNFIMCLPAILAGRGIINCMKIYFLQTTSYSEYLSMVFPGMISLLFYKFQENNRIINFNEMVSKIFILIAILIFLFMFIWLFKHKIKFDKFLIIEFALWSVMISTFFLPHMHDRYMYVAEILSVVYAFKGSKKYLFVPIILNFCSLGTYLYILFDVNIIPLYIFSLLNLSALLFVTYNLFINLKNSLEIK